MSILSPESDLAETGSRQDVVAAHNELRKERHRVELRPPEEILGCPVQGCRPGTSLIFQVSQSSRVVRKHGHRGVANQRKEMLECIKDDKKLPLVDGAASLVLRPKA